MRNISKILIIILLFLVVTGAAVVVYFYTLRAGDLRSVNPDHIISSTELVKEFEENETVANSKFVNKIIEVTGKIESINQIESEGLNISLEAENRVSAVICTLADGEDIEGYEPGQEITIRGECSGYLMDVLINRGIIVSEEPI
jgi:hypothetical protein